MEKDKLISSIEKIFTLEASNNINDETFEQEIKKIWRLVSELDGSVIPYARISQIIYKDESDFNDNNVANSIQRMEATVVKIRQDSVLDDDLLQNYGIDKIIQNLNLASTQKSFLYNNQKNEILKLKGIYKTITNNLDQQSKNIESTFKSQKNDIDMKYKDAQTDISNQVDSRMNAVYAGFISVLGIFISISFTLFGAATLLNNIFSIATRNGFNTSHDVIGANIILAGVATMLIYLLLIGIMQSVSSVTKTYYDFSLRRIFIVIFISFGIILMGLIYKNPDMSKIQSNFLIYIIIIFVYIISGFLLYRYGAKIKNRILGRKNNFRIVVLAEKDSPVNDFREHVGTVTSIKFSIKNKAQRPSHITKVLMGKDQKNAIKLNVDPFTVLSQEHKFFKVYENADIDEPLSESYLKDIEKDNYYLFFYTYSAVIKQKIKLKNK